MSRISLLYFNMVSSYSSSGYTVFKYSSSSSLGMFDIYLFYQS